MRQRERGVCDQRTAHRDQMADPNHKKITTAEEEHSKCPKPQKRETIGARCQDIWMPISNKKIGRQIVVTKKTNCANARCQIIQMENCAQIHENECQTSFRPTVVINICAWLKQKCETRCVSQIEQCKRAKQNHKDRGCNTLRCSACLRAKLSIIFVASVGDRFTNIRRQVHKYQLT